MSKKLEILPRYFGELWTFLKNHRPYVSKIQNPDQDDSYSPWVSFAAGVGIFLSILALDAAHSVRFFDRIVFFTIVLCSAVVFTITLHYVAKCFGGKATLAQAIGGGEYLIGFLLPSGAFVSYCVISTLNLFPGIKCSLGDFNLDSIVPTTLNRILLTVAIGLMISVAAYSAYRTLIMFSEIEQCGIWRTAFAMVFAVVLLVFIRPQLEYVAKLFAGELRDIANVLVGSQE